MMLSRLRANTKSAVKSRNLPHKQQTLHTARRSKSSRSASRSTTTTDAIQLLVDSQFESDYSRPIPPVICTLSSTQQLHSSARATGATLTSSSSLMSVCALLLAVAAAGEEHGNADENVDGVHVDGEGGVDGVVGRIDPRPLDNAGRIVQAKSGKEGQSAIHPHLARPGKGDTMVGKMSAGPVPLLDISRHVSIKHERYLTKGVSS